MEFNPKTFFNQGYRPYCVPLIWNPCMYMPNSGQYLVNNHFGLRNANQQHLNLRQINYNNCQSQLYQSNFGYQTTENLGKSPQIKYKLQENSQKLLQQKNENKLTTIQPQPIRTQQFLQNNKKNTDHAHKDSIDNQTGKTNWTIEQQQKLKELVNLFGKRWKYISQLFPNRSGKQIRQRYLNYLRPNLSLKKWTEQQDVQILQLVAKYGKSWRAIEKKLKNRSQNQIKNRYYGHLQKMLKRANQTEIQQSQPLKGKQQLKTSTKLSLAQQFQREKLQI